MLGRFRAWLCASLIAAFTTLAGDAVAATRFHALIVGNNDVFPGGEDERSPALVPLRYADDDAAAVGTLLGEVATTLHLLTVMDAATQALYPKLVSVARPPTLAAVEAAVASIARELERDRERGDQSVVWLFFSGHGSASYRGEPALALFGGSMSRDYLYQHVLSRLPATYVHLLVDACHAETIVRPRDSQAEVVSVSPEEANALLVGTTLASFPNVGAILVSSRDAQAHEWDAIGHGVFTHELLSALRGAADVNGDRVIEYSEISAFMSAANRGIGDARARVALSLRAPSMNRRAPLLDLTTFPPRKASWLVEVPGGRGQLQVVDDLGRRLVTLHNARDLSTSLLLPPGAALYLVAGGEEAQFSTRPGQVTRFSELKFEPSGSRSRGLRATALERGLFAVPFGRAYYQGFLDNAPDLVPVPMPRDAGVDRLQRTTPGGARHGPAHTLRLSLGAGVSSSVADSLGSNYGLRTTLAPAEGHGPSLSVEGSYDSDGPLREWRALGKLGWYFQTSGSSLRLFAGPRAGAGVVVQNLEEHSALTSAVGTLGAAAGATGRIAGQLGLFAELELAAHLLREEGATKVSAVPTGWAGAFWEM